MKKFFVLLSIALLQSSLCYSQTAGMRVDLSQSGKKVEPNQFGIFFEEINHAGDGGILAELVRNGSFTEAPTLDAWSAVHTGSSKVNIFFESAAPLSPAKPRSLRIEVNSPSGERAGIANEGYWGISINKGEAYQFSMFARAAEGFNSPVTVSLEGKDGTVYGRTEIAGIQPQWSRVTGTILANTSDPAARLIISTGHSGTFWINLVSLHPGDDIFRADLLQKLKDLKPGFMRFPGGTYVQGNERESAFRWKNTIGDLTTRPGHYDAPWSYWSTDNMGFHEYLLLCERLGATPMYVVYAGMTWTPGSKSPFGVLQQHKIPVADYPMDEMGPIVQDAVDAIEYANGPVTSTWGALRAKAGHPAPFGLKFVEIGNEDGSNALYADRYMLIYKAIKARFPDIQIIANERRGGFSNLPMDLIDEHIYTQPLGAIDRAKQLDTRDRNGVKSVLAEYAIQTSGGFGNLRSALGEAIMLNSVERNSDVMPMASYAPLLANVHSINWRPDLIYFDNKGSYGTPSYYVQKMFADSRLDTVAPVQVTASDVKLRVAGEVAAKGFGAQAEFQNESVTGGGVDYTYSVRARKTGGDGGLVIRFAVNDGGGSYLAWFLGVRHRANTLLVWGGGGNQDVPANLIESSFGGAIGPALPGAIETGQWYDVKIEVHGRHVQCFLDGKELQSAQIPESLGPSLFGAAGRTSTGEIVVRLVSTLPVGQRVDIDLAGGSAKHFSAVATTLSSANLDDENSITEPTRVAPVVQKIGSVGAKFQYQASGNSFTVIKLTPETN